MRAVLVLGTIVGCCSLSAGCRAPMPVRSEPHETALPVTERQIPAPDVSAITDLPSLGSANPLPPVGYYRLTAEECRQLACENSSLGNLIDSASTTRPPGPLAGHGAGAAIDRVRAMAGGYIAQEARNRTAGSALALYYKLLELELKSDVLASSILELDRLIQANDKLIEKGFKQTSDGFELKKQRLELEADRTRLRSGIARLNSELKSLLAIDAATAGFLLPADQVRVVPDPLDAEQAVQLGLMLRGDLNLLRCLANSVDHRTLQAVRKVLIGLAPPLAAVVQATEDLAPLLLPYVSAMAKAEVAAVRSQIMGLLQDREREVAKEIRTAAEEWTTARELVAIARQRFELHTANVGDLEKKSKVGQAVELELRKARLELLKAESELVGDIVKWKLADVKARETMGLLCGADGCGK